MHLRQDAGIFNVPESDVVGRQSKPGSIGFRDAIRHLVSHAEEITRPAVDALLRIGSVLNAQVTCRGLCQHHQATDACRRNGFWIPVGFLIADGSQQSPVDTGLTSRFFKCRQKSREPGFDVSQKGPGTDVIKLVCMPVVSLHYLGQLTALPDLLKKQLGLFKKAVVIVGECPGNGIFLLEVKTNPDLRMKIAVDRELSRVRNREIDFSSGYLVK